MHVAVLVVMLSLCAGSLLSLSTNPHWFTRAWDFPRMQIVVVGLIVTATHVAAGQWWYRSPAWLSFGVSVAMLFLIGFHGFRIYPYTPLAEKQAKSATADHESSHQLPNLRVVVSNIEEENEQYDRWMSTVRAESPDVMIVLEIDNNWVDAVNSLIEEYPHHVIHPQENWYGMMLLSKFPILKHKIHFLVQNDIPSIDAVIELHDKQSIRVVGVHPRPPEPIRDNDAAARGAELTLWGRELAEETLPVIIGGDLNDVAWSETTRLFMRLSGLLDPRRGRGFFNTFNANHVWMRFPLDHIFHSTHFTVREVRRLDFVGSDHFPILIDLQLEPAKQTGHEALEQNPEDQEEANERIKRAVEDDDLDGDARSTDGCLDGFRLLSTDSIGIAFRLV